MEEQFIEDILENSCEDTHCSEFKPRPFDIFGNNEDDYICYYYHAEGKARHCIVLR